MQDPEKLPFGWSPLALDAGKPGSTLSDWGLLPWAGVEQVVLPGFHTPAEYGLKKGGTGDEIFLTLCGLMSSGSRTVLLSRWRVGGESTSPLLSQVAIRYAPTFSLAMPDKRGLRPVPRTAIVAGKLLPRDSEQVAAELRDQVAEAAPG